MWPLLLCSLCLGLPPSGSWQDLKDHMREAGDVCYADVQKDGMGMVEYLRKEDMEYALRKLDETKFRSHEGETSYIRVYPERSTSYGYSRSRSGSRGRDSPYQSRGSPHDFSPFRPYWDRWWEFFLYFLGELSCFVLRIYIPDWWFSGLGDFFNFFFF